jgi:hypothetical protein
VPAVCHKRTGWRRSRLTQTCRPGHLYPASSNLSNQPNPLPPKFPYLCMQCTPINTHSGMPTYYGGPLRLGHGGSATIVTRRFRLLARYCFLSQVRPLVLDGDSRSDSHPCSWPNAHEQITITKLLPPPPIRACVFPLLRKPGIARFLCAIFKRDLSQRQFGPVVTVIIVIIIIIIAIRHNYLRDHLRTLPSRLVVLHPTRQPGQEEPLFLAREIQRGTWCPDPSAPRVPR